MNNSIGKDFIVSLLPGFNVKETELLYGAELSGNSTKAQNLRPNRNREGRFGLPELPACPPPFPPSLLDREIEAQRNSANKRPGAPLGNPVPSQRARLNGQGSGAGDTQIRAHYFQPMHFPVNNYYPQQFIPQYAYPSSRVQRDVQVSQVIPSTQNGEYLLGVLCQAISRFQNKDYSGAQELLEVCLKNYDAFSYVESKKLVKLQKDLENVRLERARREKAREVQEINLVNNLELPLGKGVEFIKEAMLRAANSVQNKNYIGAQHLLEACLKDSELMKITRLEIGKIHHILGNVRFAQKNYKGAQEAYEICLGCEGFVKSLSGKEQRLYFTSLGDCLTGQGKYNESREAYAEYDARGSMKSFSGISTGRINWEIGNERLQQKNFKEALGYYEICLQCPGFVRTLPGIERGEFYRALGKSRFEQQNFKGAQEAFESCKECFGYLESLSDIEKRAFAEETEEGLLESLLDL